MKACRKVRGLIAASLYEELSEDDRRVLDGHLAACAACRDEAAALANLAAEIPTSTPGLEWDLLPRVRRRLAQHQAPGRRAGWRVAVVSAACMLLVAAMIYTVRGPVYVDQAESLHVASPDVPATDESLLQAVLDESAQLLDSKEFAAVARLLIEAVEAHPDDPMAGQAQHLFASVTFEQLQW